MIAIAVYKHSTPDGVGHLFGLNNRMAKLQRRYAAHNKGRLTVRSSFFFVEPGPSGRREDDLD